MTLSELNLISFKANLYLCIGNIIGETVAFCHDIRHPLIFGLLTGLLLSAHHYHKYIAAIIAEYRRLKSGNSKNPLA